MVVETITKTHNTQKFSSEASLPSDHTKVGWSDWGGWGRIGGVGGVIGGVGGRIGGVGGRIGGVGGWGDWGGFDVWGVGEKLWVERFVR